MIVLKFTIKQAVEYLSNIIVESSMQTICKILFVWWFENEDKK